MFFVSSNNTLCCMTELVVVVGLTGVGKTSVVDGVLNYSFLDCDVISHGTELLKTATSLGLVETRDEITDIPRDEYDDLQSKTAKEIGRTVSASESDVLFFDTHATLDTPIGYRPGLTFDDLEYLSPDKFVMITASPQEIVSRRKEDETRDRTVVPASKIEEQQEIAQQMLSAMAVKTRAPIELVPNHDNEMKDAINTVVENIQRE